MEKVKLSQLNWICRIGIIGGWVLLCFWVIAFFIGFFIGIIG